MTSAEKLAHAVASMDDIEQTIFTGGMIAIRDKRMTVDQFQVWAGDLIARHRAGEDLHVADLDLPAHPTLGCLQ
jgi:hypothetical protein